MEIEKQVTNLKLSKKLEKLGVSQKSIWRWRVDKYKKTKKTEISLNCKGKNYKDYVVERKIYSSYTCAELGEKLPTDGSCYTESYAGIWYARLVNIKGNHIECKIRIEADTEANARAKLLIYLIENKLIKVEDLK